jgi:hypothetical protein
MVARIRGAQQLEKQQQQELADGAAAADAAVKDDAQLDDVITGCIGMLVTVHKLTSPPAAEDQQQLQQQQGAASIDAALEAALQLLKPKVAANSQAYADIVSSVGRLKAQLARAH